MESETIFFTVINPDTEEETRINIFINPEDKCFKVNNIPIDGQQLAELGMLLFAIANQHDSPDLDSCGELLDGFNIPVPKKALQEVMSYQCEVGLGQPPNPIIAAVDKAWLLQEAKIRHHQERLEKESLEEDE